MNLNSFKRIIFFSYNSYINSVINHITIFNQKQYDLKTISWKKSKIYSIIGKILKNSRNKRKFYFTYRILIFCTLKFNVKESFLLYDLMNNTKRGRNVLIKHIFAKKNFFFNLNK